MPMDYIEVDHIIQRKMGVDRNGPPSLIIFYSIYVNYQMKYKIFLLNLFY